MVSSMSDHQWKLSATIRYVALVSSVSTPGRTKRFLLVFFGHLYYWQHSCCPRGHMAIEPQSRAGRQEGCHKDDCVFDELNQEDPHCLVKVPCLRFNWHRAEPSQIGPSSLLTTEPLIAWSSCLLPPRSFSFTIVFVGKQDYPRWI